MRAADCCVACGSPEAYPRAGYELPLCLDCGAARERQQPRPSAKAGMIANVRGVDEDGRRPNGASGWHYRPPVPRPDLHHDQPIELNHGTHYQQAPPVFVRGESTDGNPREMARRIRSLTEREAERILLDQAIERAPREALALALGLSARQLRRRIERRNRTR